MLDYAPTCTALLWPAEKPLLPRLPRYLSTSKALGAYHSLDMIGGRYEGRVLLVFWLNDTALARWSRGKAFGRRHSRRGESTLDSGEKPPPGGTHEFGYMCSNLVVFQEVAVIRDKVDIYYPAGTDKGYRCIHEMCWLDLN